MTRILALDTSSEYCSICLLEQSDTGVVATDVLSEKAPRSHVQRLLPMCKTLLNKHGLALSDLNALAFGRGPGSFTGLRIAAGFVQGLAYGQGLPVIGVSNLRALAAQSFEAPSASDKTLVIIDARMDEIYWSVFSRSEQTLAEPVNAERVDKPESVASALDAEQPISVIGSGLLYAPRMQRISEWPRIAEQPDQIARQIALIGLSEYREGKVLRADQAAPVYVRDDVAWKKLPGRE